MIQVALFSIDRTLQSLLPSALDKEFEVQVASTEEQINHMLSSRNCDLVLLDLDSFQEPLDRALQWSRHILMSQVPLVVLASDSLRSTAAELVRTGAYGSCRRPPSIRDLRTMLIRAHESSSLKRELQDCVFRWSATFRLLCSSHRR